MSWKANLGAMRHKLDHQRATRSDPDTFGESAESWSSLGSVYAELRPLTTRELAIAQQMTPIANEMIRFQWVRDVRQGDRFVFGSRVFHAVDVSVTDETLREVRVLASEIST